MDPGTRAAATPPKRRVDRVKTRRKQNHSQSHVQSDSGHLRLDDLNEPVDKVCVRSLECCVGFYTF